MTDQTIIMYGNKWCPDCRRARIVFERLGISFTYVDVETDENAKKLVLEINQGYCSVPTIVFPDGSSLTEPDSRTLEMKLLALQN
jgi:mycoredoxin